MTNKKSTRGNTKILFGQKLGPHVNFILKPSRDLYVLVVEL